MSRALEVAAITGVVIAVWVLCLYRKKRLKEDHAILWLFVSTGIVVLAVWKGLLLAIRTVVMADATDLVLAAFTAFLLVVCIYYSVKISELTEQNRKLAQETAILKKFVKSDLKSPIESET